jgi:hypothetical protein
MAQRDAIRKAMADDPQGLQNSKREELVWFNRELGKKVDKNDFENLKTVKCNRTDLNAAA